VPTISLPEHPNLEQLRRQARTLQRAVRTGDAEAAERVRQHHPDGLPHDAAAFSLSAAQLVLAREYGFPSWPRLKQYLDLVADHGWNSPGGPDGDVAAEFCQLACLTYTFDDGPARWERARRILAERPDLAATDIWAAAAAAEVDTVRRLLEEDPGRARQRGGACRWRPLFYLAYSRHDPTVPAEPVLAIARLLLDAGADPNEGYLWHGQPYPFTLLTGVFGEGELGPERQPRHPHSLALARLLLDAGAEPNDSQTLYNRMFRPGDDHLELLFEYGLGGGDGGVWRRRLGDALAPPSELLRDQLKWAIAHGMPERVRLLVRHGVDVVSTFDGHTPAGLAVLNGDAEIAEYLVSRGSPPAGLDPAGELVGAALRADRHAVERLRVEHPDALAEARRRRPGLIVWASARGRAESVALLAELGFDVNALGRGDAPVAGEWETALHHAAAHGDLELAELLLSLGADTGIHDARFGSTPAGWAAHFGHESMVALLTG
jgi:ankyrin repeat protein